MTLVTPDLAKPENLNRWIELERAKRRLLEELKLLSLPPFLADLTRIQPLSFQFMEDAVDPAGVVTKVYTGHDQGIITVNVLEADSVHREKMRVAFGEPQRTLIGHLRHEAGHYIDWAYAWPVAPEGYKQLFGDPFERDYQQALAAYYERGPAGSWHSSYVSAYATVHPWEDFAETVNLYLDIMAIAVTANDQRLAKIDLSASAQVQDIIREVLKIVIVINEFNFDFGHLPLLPERFNEQVTAKLAFVHSLRSESLIHKLVESLSADGKNQVDAQSGYICQST